MHYNHPPLLEKILKFTCLKWLPWLEQIFEIYMSEMAKNTLESSTMVGENFEVYMSEMAKNAL